MVAGTDQQPAKYEHNQLKISTSTIYRALDEGLLDEKLCKKLRIKGRVRHGGRKKSKCGHLDIEYSIHDGLNLLINVKQLAIGKAIPFEDQSGRVHCNPCRTQEPICGTVQNSQSDG